MPQFKHVFTFIYSYKELTRSSSITHYPSSLLFALLSPTPMAFLKLNRFLPGSKAWKIFANKLHRKLHKLNTSKPIKKPYKSRYGRPSKRISWPRLCIQGYKFKPKKNLPKTLVYHHHFQRKPSSAVYVDQLFINPISVNQEVPSVTTSAVRKKEIPPSSSANKVGLGDHDEDEDSGVTGDQDSADHMWESLVLASPQLNQINERADEFIASFRQDMLLQERLAHRL